MMTSISQYIQTFSQKTTFGMIELRQLTWMLSTQLSSPDIIQSLRDKLMKQI